jgi:hypothetical protein
VQGTRTATDGMARQSIEALGRRTVDRMARELSSAGAGTLSPNRGLALGSDHLTFQVVSGYAGGAVQWSAPAAFALKLEPGELDNGKDDDGDGLVDERDLTYTQGGQETIWAHGVCELLEGEKANGKDDNGNGLKDEAGLSSPAGGTLILRLSLEARDLREGRCARWRPPCA